MKKIVILALIALFCDAALAQTRVTGTVTSSEDGTPVSFATVVVKGSNSLITSTDIDGKFAFTSIPGSAVLVVSYIGFTTQEVPVNNRSTLNIVLLPDALALQEVMVVAYGTASRRGGFTGSVATVKSSSINDLPQTSFENALVGAVSGLQLSPSSGQVGSAVSIRIRGTGSMNASNDPLYVIDGVPVIDGAVSNLNYSSNNIMNSINPNDIENISVLKDAAASSLYGSRAANGVIIITTKSGKKGKINLSLKANYGFTPSFATNALKVASAEDQRKYYYEANVVRARQQPNLYTGLPGITTPEQYAVYVENEIFDKFQNDPRGAYDWEKAIFRSAPFQNYDISAYGGDEKSSYFASFGYTDEQGRVRASGLNRWNGRLNVSQRVYNNPTSNFFNLITLLSNVSYSSTKKKGFNDTLNNGANYYQMVKNLFFPQYWPTYADGTPFTNRYRSYGQNVLYYDDFRESTSVINRLMINETLKIQLAPGLSFGSIFSYDESRVDDFSWRASNHFDATGTGNVTNNIYNYQSLSSSNTLTYDKTFADKHNVNVLLGYEVVKNNTNYTSAVGTNLPTLNTKTVSAAGTKNASGYSYGNRMMSVLSRVEYNYDNKYYVSGSYRKDGSSKLSAKSRWGDFWATGASWRVSEEGFMKGITSVSNLKIKASYGINGTLPDNNYGHIPLYSFGYNYNSNPGGYVSTVADLNLRWETSYTYNIGVEAGLFANRLNVSIEYYNRDSKDLLQNVSISNVTGFDRILSNIGSINNHGFEIEIGGDIIRKKDMRWYLSWNGATLNSAVTKLYEGADLIWYDPRGGDSQARFIYREGVSPRSFWGRQWAGVDPDNGDPLWYSNNNNAIKQINGRNVVNHVSAADYVITGCADPKLYGGITTNFTWKKIAVDLVFNYSLGGDAFDSFERYTNSDSYWFARPIVVKALDYWKKPGDVTQAPRLGLNEADLFIRDQDRYLYRNNFIRLKSSRISYSFPESLTRSIGLTRGRVYFSGTNLLTFASQKQFDPEVSILGVTSWQMPIGKTYTFGIELTF